MKKHVIIAPHADDELIGCYEILSKYKTEIIFTDVSDKIRMDETKQLKEWFDVEDIYFSTCQNYITGRYNGYSKTETILYFPDPIFEFHPTHRMIGHDGEKLARMGYDVIFYSVNMQAPYIHEVRQNTEKYNILCDIYPSQQALWENDAKYYLFEGRCKWLDLENK